MLTFVLRRIVYSIPVLLIASVLVFVFVYNTTGHDVRTDLTTAFKNTLQLIGWGVGIAALLAIGVGVYSAVRQYSALDYTFTGLSFVGLSMPPFWFGLVAIQFFTITLPHWFGSHNPTFFSIGLHNALIPLVTVMAVDIGALFGGLVVTEQIFSIPGMGKLFIESLQNGDTNVLLPWLMVTATFIIIFNLLADVLYGVLDPRIRLA